MWKKNWKRDFFFTLNLLNEAECLVSAQIKKQKYEYSLKRYYRTCHINGVFFSAKKISPSYKVH